jgi:hypothetical protein
MRRRCCCGKGKCFADFIVEKLDTSEGLSFRFTSTARPARGATALLYLWDFGDGTTSTTGPTVVHTYAEPGIYLVRLVFTDSAGHTCTAEKNVNAADYGLVVFFITLCFAGRTVRFFDRSYVPAGKSPPVIRRVELDWGDGSPVEIIAPYVTQKDHGYPADGSYSITLSYYGDNDELLGRWVDAIDLGPHLLCVCCNQFRVWDRWAITFSNSNTLMATPEVPWCENCNNLSTPHVGGLVGGSTGCAPGSTVTLITPDSWWTNCGGLHNWGAIIWEPVRLTCEGNTLWPTDPVSGNPIQPTTRQFSLAGRYFGPTRPRRLVGLQDWVATVPRQSSYAQPVTMPLVRCIGDDGGGFPFCGPGGCIQAVTITPV